MGSVPAIVIALAAGATNGASASSSSTDFGIRDLGRATLSTAQLSTASRVTYRQLQGGKPIDLQVISALASNWGRVTSTWRSPARNRRVGGVPNSYHLSGRAIDIARRPHVSHAQIAQDFRRNGYHLIESLDEGDHSHFAFGSATAVRATATSVEKPVGDGTAWRIVSAPR